MKSGCDDCLYEYTPCEDCNHVGRDNGSEYIPKFAPSGWISVKDGLPKKDGRYIVYDSHGQDVTEMHFITGDYDNSGWYVSAYHKADTGQITHWQPLPSPPKEGE